MNGPTNRQQDLCAYLGIFGVLIALTCIISSYHCKCALDSLHLAGHVFIYSYFFHFACTSKIGSSTFVIISSFLYLLSEAVLILTGLFSAIVIIQFVYSVVVTVFIYMDEIPKRLKEKAVLLKAEKDSWVGKI